MTNSNAGHILDLYQREEAAFVARPDSFWQEQLNDSQWEAVRHCDRPLLVIAGAGSGKTRVLTYKIAYLLEHGYKPWDILAITFTNKAAKEMNERIARIVGPGRSRGLWSGTFHSCFARILRAESEAVGMKSDFSIYDAADSRSLIKSIIKERGLNDKTYAPSRIQGRISSAKNNLILPQDYAADAQIQAYDQREGIGETHHIYTEYFRRCRTAGAFDFDDLLLYTYLLFAHNEEIRRRYGQRFKYLLVDEYQDTNYAQHAIVSLLTRDNPHICVVGDDAQSIYSFRGAKIDNILHFHRQYPEAITVKLEQNYRSTKNIVGAANSIIAHNKGQIEKVVFSENEEGDKVRVMPAATDKEEAAKVVGVIARLHRTESVGFDQIAILYRTNAQSRSFEDVLRERNFPYRIYGGLSFYQRKEIKDILAYLRLLSNLDDEEAFKRVVNYPARGIGNTTLQKLFTASREHGVSLWSVAEHPDAYGVALNRGTLGKLAAFCTLLRDFQAQAARLGAFDLVLKVISESGIKADLDREDGPEGDSRRENVEELLGAIRSFEHEVLGENTQERVPVTDYLQQSALQTDADEKDDGTPKITLMTIHAAKGLEFDAVFVTGLEENLFPGSQARLFANEMEEERRLFYVAVTRAKRFCYLSYAQSRYRYGNLEVSDESLFVGEIDRRFVVKDASSSDALIGGIAPSLRKALFGGDSAAEPPRPKPAFRPSCFETSAPSRGEQTSRPAPLAKPSRRVETPPAAISGSVHPAGLAIGTCIDHERFGRGRITQIEGSGDNAKATVEFDLSGRKNLLLKFAKFTVVEA